MELHNARSSFVHRLAMGALFAVLAIGGSCGSASAVEVMSATGLQHSVYLADDGSVWCWGSNGYGQLGNNSLTDSALPVQVRTGPGAGQLLTNVVQIAAGYQHSYALKADGTVWGWGRNDFYGGLGQGVGGTTRYQVAIQIPGLGGIKAIASGGFTGYALSAFGSLRAWGYNGLSCIGDGTSIDRLSAVSVPLANVREIAGGLYHAAAVLTDGTVRCWGSDQSGQLGNGALNDGGANASPVVVSGLVNVVSIACGNNHTLASLSTGRIAAWGLNSSGQLGNGVTVNSNVPVTHWDYCRRVFASGDHSMLQQIWGGFYTFGSNSVGQCGQTGPGFYSSPSFLGYYAKGGSGHGNHLLVVGNDAQFWSCGNNDAGQIGNGLTGGSTSTIAVASAQWPVANLVDIGASTYTAHAVKSDGTLFGWGYNTDGTLGDGTTTNQSTPVAINLSDVMRVAGGQIGYHTLAMTWSGNVYAWGKNNKGQLGNGVTSTTGTTTPTLVGGVSYMREIASGGSHSLALDRSGNVYAWGDDSFGQVGDDAIFDNNRPSPVLVYTSTGVILTNVIAIAAGHQHSLALRADGTVWAWGGGGNSQIGNGLTANQPRAVQVTSLTNIVAIGAGYLSSYAIKSNGEVMAWGNNVYGQLGTGGTVSASTPVNVRLNATTVLSGATSISGGIYHAIACTPGQVMGWGYNYYGQLGTGTTTDSLYAVSPIGILMPAKIVAGAYQSYVLLADGTVGACGYNGLGQLGNGGVLTLNPTPVTTTRQWLPQVSLVITDADAGESGPNTGSFQVTRTFSTAGALTVAYTVSGTATTGSDYVTPTGTATIPVGQASATVVGIPIDDDEDEAIETETAIPAVSGSAVYRIGTPNSGVINIADNDSAGVTFVVTSAITFESDNNSTARTFGVRLASRPTAAVTLTFASSNTLEAQVDTNSAAGNQAAGSLTILPAQWNTIRTIQVFGQQDSVDDGDISYSIQTSGVVSADAKYNGLSVGDQAWTNSDDDVAGIVVSSTFGAVTEAGGTATFNIRLTSQPYDRVDFTLVSSDVTEGQLQSGFEAVTLTAGNWSAGVEVTVMGLDDPIDDGDIAFRIDIGKSISNDPAYDSRGGWDVTGTCTDDDTKGVQLSTATVTAAEDGSVNGSFTVRLTSEPIGASTVVVTFAGDSQVAVDTDPGTTGNQTSLSFTTANWNNPRTVAVSAIDDALIEGIHSGTVTATVAGTGTDYATGVTVVSVVCSVTDNDSPGFTLSPATMLGSRQTTSEPAVPATFTIRLNTQPPVGKTVTVKLWSNDASEGQLSTTPLVRASIGTTGATNTITLSDVSGISPGDWVWITGGGNNNNQQAQVTSVGASSIVVNASPTLNNAGSETVTIYPRLSLTFTNASWNTPQTVTVTGQDDAVVDTVGQQSYLVLFEIETASASHDANYTATLAPTQFMKNLDNDIPGLQTVQSSGSTAVAEGAVATTDSFTVQLTTAPTNPVTVTIGGGSQVAVDKTAIFFTTGNWFTPQTVTVTVVDDAVDETAFHTGSIAFTTSSSDGNYNAMPVDSVAVSVADNDTAGISVIPTNGLATTEAGGVASFSVSLNSQPTANVVLGVASSNVSEGTVSTAALTFTSATWYQPQTVTVTGVNDSLDDGDLAYVIAIAADATTTDLNYRTDPADVNVINIDNDTAGVTITQSGGSTTASEAGAGDTFTVVLNTQPTGTVTMTVNPGSQCTVAATSLTFTGGILGTWSIPQTVTVGAVNDAFAEGLHTGTITHSASGGGYGSVPIASVSPSITDNDTAGVTVSATAVTCTEAGGSGAFTIRLNSQPTANVTVVLASSDTTEGTVSPASLTFTPTDYLTPQAVTINGVDDALDDGDIAFAISMALVSADSVYNNFAVTSKAVTCTDNDSAGFTISAASSATTEAGGQATFSVRLNSQPTAAVTIGIASNNVSEGIAAISSLTFSASDWNDLQYVTVTGQNDDLRDGDIAYAIVTTADATTTDATYRNLDPANVAITNLDNDTVGVLVSTPSVATSENGASVSFTVVLRSQPTSDVSIAVSSSDTTEATVSTASLTFTALTWNTAQTVTVTPVDDFQVDGSVAYTVVLANASSADTTGYSALNVPDVDGTSGDDDSAGFTVSAVSGPTSEIGGSATFTVVLNSQPSADVTITLGGLDTTEGSLAATTLTFVNASSPAANAWNSAQPVTVTGLDDSIDDGDIAYAISLTPSSADSVYSAVAAQNVSVTNTDNDSDGVTITETAGGTTVDESGATDTYTIVFNAAPQSGPVTITVTPDSQVVVNGGGTTYTTPTALTLTFDPALTAPAANAWNQPHIVTVTAVQDVFNETNPHSSTITHGVTNYGAITATPITVTVIDNDPPQVPTNLGLTVGRSGGATITPTMLAVTDDVTPSAALLLALILAPGQGDLLLSAVPLANGATFTMADITAGNLSYQNNGTPNTSDGFAFKVADAIGNESGLTLFNITITGFNSPVIAFNSATAIAYTENDAATLVDIAAGASDPDSVYYSTLTVDLVGGTVNDLLTIRNQGTAAGQIGLSGGNVTYASTIIGTWTGGTNGPTPLVIAFGANLAGDAEASALISNIQFRNSSDAPTGGTCTVRFVLRDDSATENSLGFTKDVVVTPVNDAPVFVDSMMITPANAAITGTLNVADADTYPLELTVLTVPGKGTLSAGLTVGTPTSLASALSATTFVYTPTAGQSGTDSFTVSASDGTLTTTATITVIITGGAAARPWITSDPPAEAEAGAPLSYDILLHFDDLATPPTAGQITYALIGTLPAGVTFGGFTPNGRNATLTLSIAAGATGTIAVGVSVTVDTGGVGGQSSTLQPLTIQIVPAGSLGG